jgi:DNA-directed RNA polymerase subunit M/transcription elongation factor TFIIS
MDLHCPYCNTLLSLVLPANTSGSISEAVFDCSNCGQAIRLDEKTVQIIALTGEVERKKNQIDQLESKLLLVKAERQALQDRENIAWPVTGLVLFWFSVLSIPTHFWFTQWLRLTLGGTMLIGYPFLLAVLRYPQSGSLQQSRCAGKWIVSSFLISYAIIAIKK